MSHRSDQPLEVPESEVDHGFADDGPMYPDYWPNKLGHLDMREWWGSRADDLEEHADLERRDRARAQLGGFGFGSGS